MATLEEIVDIRNRGLSKTYLASLIGPSQVGPQGPVGPAGADLTGPLNIDGGMPQSFYAGMANIDAGYYNETYGGILYGLNGGTP